MKSSDRAYLFNKWANKVEVDIDEAIECGDIINVRTGDAAKKKYIITLLYDRGIPYRVTNIGAGVTAITTNTDTCPCCKRKLGT